MSAVPEVTPRTWHRLLRLVPVVAAVLVLVEWGLAWHFGAAHPDQDGYAYLVEGILSTPVLIGITWVLAARRPDLAVTWAFCATLLAGAVQGATGTYGHEAVLGHPGLSGGVVALAVSSVAQGLAVATTLLLINLFPTGTAASSRWRIALWLTWAAMPLALIPPLLGPSPFGDAVHLPALASIPGLLHGAVPSAVHEGVRLLAGVQGVTVVVVTVLHVVARFRASSGVERQQMRLFVRSVVAGFAVIVVPWDLPIEAVAAVTVPDWLPWSIGPVLVWGGMAMAVVRHRLYDIDRIVSRTVSWAVVTMALLGLYLGVVVVLQLAARPVLGDGDLPVALATLAAAAAARPLLSRVRAVVDRRFNRARYDAARTVEAFGHALRDEVGLEAIIGGLRTTTVDSVQPAVVGIHLVPPGRSGP